MGARLLNQMVLSPLKDIEEINYRQDGVAELVNASVVRMGLSEALKDVKDMERLSGKISNGNLMPRDCVALAGSLATLPTIKFRLLGFSSKIIKDIDDSLVDMKPLADLLYAAIDPNAPALMKDGRYIKEGFNRSKF